MKLGILDVVSARVLIPWTGVWVADVELDVGSLEAMPTGRQTLTIASRTLVGTIDETVSGRFGEKASVRVVGGNNAWQTDVTRQDFANDATSGVRSSEVVAATASQIGEVIDDPTPLSYGPQFTRGRGPARKVLDGRQWYVDLGGVGHVAPWPPGTLPDNADVMSYDWEDRRAEVSSDEVILPGTVITDDRFGTVTVRDVEQSFSREGSRGSVWTGETASSRISTLLDAIGRAFDGNEWRQMYKYRVVEVGSDLRLKLQSETPSNIVPDMLPLVVWPGVSGATSKPTPGTMVIVAFFEGDPSKPFVMGFDGTSPTELYFDATTLIRLGANAVSFAAKAITVDAIFSALTTLTIALNTYAGAIQGIADPSGTATSTLSSAITAFNAAVSSTAATKVKVE